MKRIEFSKTVGAAALIAAAVGVSGVAAPAAHAQAGGSTMPPTNRGSNGGTMPPTINLPNTQSPGGNGTGAAGTPTGAAAASATAVNGQNNGQNSGAAGNAAGRGGASGTPTTSLVPVMERAAAMMQTARERMSVAPGGARESYAAAANSFQRLFSTYGVNPGLGSDRRAGITVSSYQIAEDIRTLRAAAKGTSGARATSLQQAASHYASGANSFFTGQVREALLGPNNRPPVAIRDTGRNSRNGRTARASSSVRRDPTYEYYDGLTGQLSNTPPAPAYTPPAAANPAPVDVAAGSNASGYPPVVVQNGLPYGFGFNYSYSGPQTYLPQTGPGFPVIQLQGGFGSFGGYQAPIQQTPSVILNPVFGFFPGFGYGGYGGYNGYGYGY